MFNQDLVNGKWTEIKGEVQKMWGRLTDDELTQTKGDLKAIQGLIQQRYGDEKVNFETKFSELLNRVLVSKDDALNPDISSESRHLDFFDENFLA